MTDTDREYYRSRATDARQREAAAADDASMRAHSEMADRYEQLADDLDGQAEVVEDIEE